MLFDSHLHLADEYTNLDKSKVSSILENAKQNNIEYLISNSLCKRTISENIELMKSHTNILAGIGFFPTEFKNEKDLEKIAILKDSINNLQQEGFGDRIVIGEVGLDYKEEDSNKEIQEKALKEILKIAKNNSLFVEIHSRFAVKQVVNLLEEFDYNKIIMHWFLDSKKYIDRIAKKGYYLTLGPKYLYDENVFENIKDVPTNQILFETDYPAKVSNRMHLPEAIKEIALKYSKDMEYSFEDLLEIQKESFYKIFPNL